MNCVFLDPLKTQLVIRTLKNEYFFTVTALYDTITLIRFLSLQIPPWISDIKR